MNLSERLAQTCFCPLCGRPNACAMAADQGGEAPCWCTGERFGAQLLQQAQAAQASQVMKSCICQACVRASQEGL